MLLSASLRLSHRIAAIGAVGALGLVSVMTVQWLESGSWLPSIPTSAILRRHAGQPAFRDPLAGATGGKGLLAAQRHYVCRPACRVFKGGHRWAHRPQGERHCSEKDDRLTKDVAEVATGSKSTPKRSRIWCWTSQKMGLNREVRPSGNSPAVGS